MTETKTRNLRELGPGECADKINKLNETRDETVQAAMQKAGKKATEIINGKIRKLHDRCSDSASAQRMMGNDVAVDASDDEGDDEE